MPNYLFRCPECKLEIEITLPYNHEDQKCKECEATLKKVLTPSTIVYKCGGFYTTDYGRKRK